MFYNFLSGGIFVSNLVAALFFFRFWRRTRDRLFILFALAFALMSAERVASAISLSSFGETHFAVYSFRLLAFCLIIIGVVDKNLNTRDSPPQQR